MLNRQDLIEILRNNGYTKKDADTVTKDIFKTISKILADGESLNIYGFGRFEIRQHKEKKVRDVVTGEDIIVPPSKAPKFVAGEKLKKAVKEGFLRE